jgi:acyl-coenzyme A thioesterase PaaI-like protein
MGSRDCFACGSENPTGLHLHFTQVDGGVRTTTVLKERFGGWHGIAHGGVTATLLDEAASYVGYVMGLVTVTARLEVRFSKPVPLNVPLALHGWLVGRRRTLIDAAADLRYDDDLLASARATLMVLGEHTGEEVSIEQYLKG